MWLFLVLACLIQQTTNSEESFRRRHLNPQGFLTIPEIIQYWGYPSEMYEVLTDDGYYLQLNRIPHGKHCPRNEGFVASAILPYLSERVKLFIGLTPGYTLKDMSGLFAVIVRIPEGLKRLIWGTKEFSLLNERIKTIMIYACSYPPIDQLCLQFIFLSGGYNEKNLNVSWADVYTGFFPDYSSVKNLNHWSQIIHSLEFKYYDYGHKNMEVYNMTVLHE